MPCSIYLSVSIVKTTAGGGEIAAGWWCVITGDGTAHSRAGAKRHLYTWGRRGSGTWVDKSSDRVIAPHTYVLVYESFQHLSVSFCLLFPTSRKTNFVNICQLLSAFILPDVPQSPRHRFGSDRALLHLCPSEPRGPPRVKHGASHGARSAARR